MGVSESQHSKTKTRHYKFSFYFQIEKEPFLIPTEDPEQEKLNDAAIQELMSDAKKRNNAAQVEGISAFKTRQKVNKMFLARTIKVNFLESN